MESGWASTSRNRNKGKQEMTATTKMQLKCTWASRKLYQVRCKVAVYANTRSHTNNILSICQPTQLFCIHYGNEYGQCCIDYLKCSKHWSCVQMTASSWSFAFQKWKTEFNDEHIRLAYSSVRFQLSRNGLFANAEPFLLSVYDFVLWTFFCTNFHFSPQSRCVLDRFCHWNVCRFSWFLCRQVRFPQRYHKHWYSSAFSTCMIQSFFHFCWCSFYRITTVRIFFFLSFHSTSIRMNKRWRYPEREAERVFEPFFVFIMMMIIVWHYCISLNFLNFLYLHSGVPVFVIVCCLTHLSRCVSLFLISNETLARTHTNHHLNICKHENPNNILCWIAEHTVQQYFAFMRC